MTTRTRSKLRHYARMLDPRNVMSSIRYSVSIYEQRTRRKAKPDHWYRGFSATVSLSDCNRTIEWSGYGRSGVKRMRRKIDNALKVLHRCRDDLEELIDEYETYNTTRGSEHDYD